MHPRRARLAIQTDTRVQGDGVFGAGAGAQPTLHAVLLHEGQLGPLATLGIVVDRHIPADDILFADVSVIRPAFMAIPGKGHFFIEEMAKTHSGTNWQLYGEIGLEYGPEVWHGKITDLATS